MRALTIPAVALLCAASAQLRMTFGSGVIAGRVVAAATRTPIAGASVWLHQTRSGYYTSTVLSDSGGVFRFEGLATGEFDISVSKTGFVGGAPGKLRPTGDPVWITLAPAQRREDLTIVMFAAAAIEGRVVDERGQPLRGVSVQAWPRHPDQIVGYTSPGQTDSNGRYRIAGLTPATYVVAVPVRHETFRQAAIRSSPCVPQPPGATPPPLPRPVGTLYTEVSRGIPQPAAAVNGERRTYRTTYHPDRVDPAEAVELTLTPGATSSNIDIRLAPAPAATIKGRLTSVRTLAHGAEVRLKLAGEPHEDAAEALAWADADGTFTMIDVPVGSFILQPARYAGQASCDVIVFDQASELTRLPIQIPSEGLNDLVVSLAEGVSASGTVVFKGTSRPAALVDLFLLSFDRPNKSPGAWIGIDGDRFHVEGLLPGAYELQAFDNALDIVWRLESVSIDGRDVTGKPVMVQDTDLNNIVVSLTDRPASLAGSVTARVGSGEVDSTVVLFPTDRSLWPYALHRSQRFPTTRAPQGLYRFPHILPGEYFLAAIDETTMDAWPAADFLSRIAGYAERIEISPRIPQRRNLTKRGER